MKTQNKFEKFHITTQNTAEDFLTDQMLYFVIVKNLEIIGEAAYMLTKEFMTPTALSTYGYCFPTQD